MQEAAPLMFHKDVYIPEHARAPIFTGELKYSRHALNVSSGSDSITALTLPVSFDGKGATLVEAELNPTTGEVEKQVWRMPLTEKDDLCFPLLPNGVVKTVWLNARTDTHETLRKTRYVGGAKWRGMKNKLFAAKSVN